MYVTADLGTTWHRIGSLPDLATSGGTDSTAVLPDGRLLMGPADGLSWRATDATNTRFESIDTGPIDSVVAAGDRLYGLGGRTALDGTCGCRKTPGRRGGKCSTLTVLHPASRQSPPIGCGCPDSQRGRRRRAPPAQRRRRSPAGSVLVVYGDSGDDRHRTAWRLHGPHDQVLAGGLDATSVTPAGDGFFLDIDEGGSKFVASNGDISRITIKQSARLPVRAGDVLVEGWGVLRRSDATLFTGVADPNGTITAVDSLGRTPARGRDSRGQTVVRWATPGSAGAAASSARPRGGTIWAGRGSILIITGWRRIYLSADAGATWDLLTHGATAYSGPPTFGVRPDGSILGGDFKAGFRVSHDLHTFQTPEYADIFDDNYIGTCSLEAPEATSKSRATNSTGCDSPSGSTYPCSCSSAQEAAPTPGIDGHSPTRDAAWRTRGHVAEIGSEHWLVGSGRLEIMFVEPRGKTPSDTVWRRFTSPSQWPSWAPQIRDVTPADSGLRLGGTGRVLGPGPLAVDYEVTEVDAGLRVWSWEVGIGHARVRMHRYVLPTAEGGSRALMQVHGPVAVPAQAAGPWHVPHCADWSPCLRPRPR